MATPADGPHDNPTVTGDGPYYRQVHPNHFQNGLALPGSFILHDTGCHFGLSLHDGARTTAERCHREYTQNGGNRSGAVVQVSRQELTDTGVSVVVDSPDGITFAHVDALYEKPMSNPLRSNAGKALLTAANRRGPAYVPNQ